MRSIYLFLLMLCFSLVTAQAQTKEEQAALDLQYAGKTDEAIAAFNNILKTGPGNTNIMNQLAACYYDKGDYATSYKMAGDALTLAKGNPAFMVSRARAAIELNKPDEALSLMDELTTKDATQAYAHILRGQAFEQKDMVQQAIGAYSKCLQVDPTMVLAYRYRGSAFQSISRYEDALKDFNQFIAADQSSSSVYNMRGMVCWRLGKRQEAIADYSKSVEIAPNNYFALSNRGLAYLDGKQIASAKADFQKSITLNDQYSEGYYGMARVNNEEKAHTEALTMINKAIALAPNMQPYYSIQCVTYIWLNREKEAIAVADKMLSTNGANTDAWLYKAMAQNNTKDFAGGISTMNSAIAKVPDNYLLYSMRARIYREQGNTSAADADDAKAKQLASK